MVGFVYFLVVIGFRYRILCTTSWGVFVWLLLLLLKCKYAAGYSFVNQDNCAHKKHESNKLRLNCATGACAVLERSYEFVGEE